MDFSLFRLDALHPKAYEAFQASHDLEAVVNKVLAPQAASGNDQIASLKKDLSVKASTMTPVHPMLVNNANFLVQIYMTCPFVDNHSKSHEKLVLPSYI